MGSALVRRGPIFAFASSRLDFFFYSYSYKRKKHDEMIAIGSSLFKDITSDFECCSFASPLVKSVQCSSTTFSNLLATQTKSNSGAIFCNNTELSIRNTCMFLCRSANTINDYAANAVMVINSTVSIEGAAICHCYDTEDFAESPCCALWSSSSPLKSSNFSDNVAHSSYNWGSSVFEYSACNKVKVSFVTHVNASGRRTIWGSKGTVAHTNIVKFEGEFIFEDISEISDCCIFDSNFNKIPANVTIVNCISDNKLLCSKIAETTYLPHLKQGFCQEIISKIHKRQRIKAITVLCTFCCY